LQDTLIAANVSSKPASSIVCAKGCAHCCTTAVSATIPEVLALAAALRADPTRAMRVRVAAERAATTTGDWWSVARRDCPVLENSACGAYDARPGACRGLLSTSLSACAEIFHSNTNTPMAYPGDSAALRTVTVVMMKAALRVSGLGAAHVALSPALAIALTVPDAEARWLAGEPLFNAAPPDNAEQNLYLRSLVEGLAEAIRPTL
jgi:Fe-S-cluster containining protein